MRHQQSRNYLSLLQNRIDALSLQCIQHIREENSGLWFTAEELKGIPQTALWKLRQGLSGSKNGRKLWIAFDSMDLNFTLTYIENPEVRKRIYIGSEHCCHKNFLLVWELTYSCAEKASLLRFDNHVEFMTEDMMMDSKSTESFFCES
jgi:metallopeptidase MepB